MAHQDWIKEIAKADFGAAVAPTGSQLNSKNALGTGLTSVRIDGVTMRDMFDSLASAIETFNHYSQFKRRLTLLPLQSPTGNDLIGIVILAGSLKVALTIEEGARLRLRASRLQGFSLRQGDLYTLTPMRDELGGRLWVKEDTMALSDDYVIRQILVDFVRLAKAQGELV